MAVHEYHACCSHVTFPAIAYHTALDFGRHALWNHVKEGNATLLTRCWGRRDPIHRSRAGIDHWGWRVRDTQSHDHQKRTDNGTVSMPDYAGVPTFTMRLYVRNATSQTFYSWPAGYCGGSNRRVCANEATAPPGNVDQWWGL